MQPIPNDSDPVVDHINSNSLDDRPENLREASYQLNARNHIRRNIRFVEKTGKYQVRLGKLQVGSFKSKQDAIQAYDTERRRIWQT